MNFFKISTGDVLLSRRFAFHVKRGEEKHVCVCICTYKRPELLKHLLSELAKQETAGLFTYSIVVVDNDYLESAKQIVTEFASMSSLHVKYCVESQQNIALARNKAVENATGDFVAFIDDDEYPTKTWLLTLIQACYEFNVDGVLGPVNPVFSQAAPQWVIDGRFHHRPTYPTGLVIDWRKGRTGNVLLKMELFSDTKEPFRQEFRSGEDQEFFRRMIEKGNVFIWCNEAVVYEVVPRTRCSRSFLIRRALLRGSVEPKTAKFGMGDVSKSVVAIFVCSVVLPFSLVLRHHRFVGLCEKLFYHIGKLLAVMGVDPIRVTYVTE
jgi:glycosyltransferase involved in cell wall biosynthesis